MKHFAIDSCTLCHIDAEAVRCNSWFEAVAEPDLLLPALHLLRVDITGHLVKRDSRVRSVVLYKHVVVCREERATSDFVNKVR